MDDRFAPQPIARWYMVAAVVSLLLMVLPAVGAGIHLTTNAASLPLDQRAQYEAEPLWMVLAFGLTGLTGAAGGLMLVLRRRLAEQLMLVALICATCFRPTRLPWPRLSWPSCGRSIGSRVTRACGAGYGKGRRSQHPNALSLAM